MDTLWIVTANAAKARVCERQADGSLVEVADLIHPESRQPGRRSELSLGDHQRGHSAYEPPTDVHAKEHQRFARELAARLDDAIAQGRCRRLALFASPAFLGLLRAQLGDAAAKAVRVSEPVDLTAVPLHELRGRVDALLKQAG
jgi:protein required for attachment to host cells